MLQCILFYIQMLNVISIYNYTPRAGATINTIVLISPFRASASERACSGSACRLRSFPFFFLLHAMAGILQPSLTVRRCRRPSSSTPSSAVWYVLPSLYPLFNQVLALRLLPVADPAGSPGRPRTTLELGSNYF